MYKIYLNDNNNKNIKETFNILEENLEEYVIYRNEINMNEEYIIEECNDIRVNMYLSINIYDEEKNKIYYNKNNSYSYYIYNLIKKEFDRNQILLEYDNKKKKDIVDIFSPCVRIELNKRDFNKEILIRVLKQVIINYFNQEEI